MFFSAPLDVVLSHYDVVEPDLLFVAGDQTAIMTEKNIQGPPALVVEVLSKGTRKRDAQIKRRLFERTGVREYWLVDPELDTVQVFRPSTEGKLARVAELTAEDDHDADHAAFARLRDWPARAVPRTGLTSRPLAFVRSHAGASGGRHHYGAILVAWPV